MNAETTHPLKVFLCHASGDKPPVRDLYKRLVAEGVDAWLDQEKLLPGQDWRLEIPRAVKEADVVVICLSKKSITKEGYVQKEIKFALDIAEEKPEGTIFLIPARLEDCTVPERLSRWQWVDLYEENGFVKLLRSLKLRADAVGAKIEPASYEDTGGEIERKLKQLYTEGLAAFYTEDWDRACHRFQTILSEQPNHQNAAEKLAEAERQRYLSRLYAQASEAVRSEDWGTAIKTLEELSQKSVDYKDAASLLRNARKQKQLKDLYREANTLHDAQKWDAVLKVFEQIVAIEPNYSDPNGLFPSAQKEVAELKRLAELNELYDNAVREMDAGHWIEARQLLEKIHKSQLGFLETERLLRKVEEEIAKAEEQTRRKEQVNVLYEQAHGLLRSKKWRKVLEKLEQIRELDDDFRDTDGIAERAQKELALEEQEAERQNKLAALYAEAIRRLKEERYQEALDRWQEVRTIDPKYPDRQWVQRTARRKLAEAARQLQIKPRITISKSLWIGIAGFIVVGVVIASMVFSIKEAQKVSPSPVSELDGIPASLSATDEMPASTLEPGLIYREDFETGQAGNWTLDPGWKVAQDGSNHVLRGEGFQFAEYEAGKEWIDYLVRFKLKLLQGAVHLDYRRTDNSNRAASVTSAGYFVEFRENYLSLSKMISGDWMVRCGKDVKFATNTWHEVEVAVDQNDFLVHIDGALAVQCPDTDPVRGGTIWFDTMEDSQASIDDIEVDLLPTADVFANPPMYDDFDNTAFGGNFNSVLWQYSYTGGKIYQENGNLVFDIDQTGQESLYAGLIAKDYSSYRIAHPISFEAKMSLDTDDDGGVFMQIESVDGRFVFGCGIESRPSSHAKCFQFERDGVYETIFSNEYERSSWRTFRFTVEPATNKIYFYMDDKLMGSSTYLDTFGNTFHHLYVQGFVTDRGKSTGLVDYIRIGEWDEPGSASLPVITPSTPSPPPLPGTLVLPIEAFEKTIPWLPLDTSAVPAVHFIAFNTIHLPFNDALVRQAFAYAIDRQQIVDMAIKYKVNNPRLATTLTPPGTLGRDLYGEVGIEFDPQKAKELFSKAGFSDPSVFPTVTFLVSATGDVAPGARFNMASAMAEMWRTHLGVTVQVQAMNWTDFTNRLQTDPPDLYWLGWVADQNDPDFFLRGIFHSSSQFNFGNFSNSEFDQLVDLAEKSNDPAKRQELYIRAERILCEMEAAVIPIYHTTHP